MGYKDQAMLGQLLGFGSSSVIDWLATSVGGCKAWYRGGLGLTSTTWADQSGNGIDLSGTCSVISGALNGRKAARFNGTSDIMKSAAASLTLAQPFTLVMTFKIISFPALNTYFWTDSASGVALYNPTTSVDVTMYTAGGTVANVDQVVGSYGHFFGFYNGASSKAHVGLHTDTTGTLGSTGISSYHAIGAFTTPSNYGNIEVAELIIYDHALSNGDASAVLTGLTGLYGAGT